MNSGDGVTNFSLEITDSKMGFTDRYIEFPIKVYDTKHKDLIGEEILVDDIEKIYPFDIVRYRKHIDDNNTACVTVTFKDGTNSLVYLTIWEFEKKLNAFCK